MVNVLKFQILYTILFCLFFLMHLLHKTFGGKVSSVDPDQIVQEQPDLGLQYSALCIYMYHSYSIR